MKKLITPFLLAVSLLVAAPISLTFTGCAAPANERVAAVQTLKAAGQTAEAAVELSARLYAGGTITPEQAREVADFYDTRWQPAYRFAVTAAHGDLTSIASPDLWSLLNQLTALVASYQSTP